MQKLELLEKKEDVLLKKVNAEKEKAIEFIRRKNKRGIGFSLISFYICVCVRNV